MTYQELVHDFLELAGELEQHVRESQVISLNDQVTDDDTIIFFLEDRISEMFDNATGNYGHMVEIKKEKF